MRGRLKVLATAVTVAATLIALPSGEARAANCDGDPGEIHLFSWIRGPVPEPVAGASGQTTIGQPSSLSTKCVVDPSVDTNYIYPGATYVSARFGVNAPPGSSITAQLSGIINGSFEMKCQPLSLARTVLSLVPAVDAAVFGTECLYATVLLALPPGASLLPGTQTVNVNGHVDTWRTVSTP